MMSPSVQVRELAAWGLDAYEHRPAHLCALTGEVLTRRAAYSTASPIAPAQSDNLRAKLAQHADRADLRLEMQGLAWRLDVIDLRLLLSFQRRLQFDPRWNVRSIKPQNNADILDLCFGQPQTPTCDAERIDGRTLQLHSSNPNLQVSLSAQAPHLAISCGSPFLEVAEYRGRWFLRDGYHRAFHLLEQGIACVPAVVIHAQSLTELGAERPRFFPESILFSDQPPRVVDFLNDELNFIYTRPALRKTIQITINESYTPETDTGEQQ